jgi:integrase
MPRREKVKAARSGQHLRYVGLSPRTLLLYRRAVSSFFAYLGLHRLPLPTSYSELDHTLADYVNHLWLDDLPLGEAGLVLSAFHRFVPEARGKLPTAWQFFTNWQRTHTPSRATPFPPIVVRALAFAAYEVQRCDLGVLLLLGFTCLLRTGELLSLRWEHVSFCCDSGKGVVSLPATKTSRSKRAFEQVYFVDRRLCRALQEAKCASLGFGLVYEKGPRDFRCEFRSLLRAFSLQDFGFLPYSLRRGGASWVFAGSHSYDLTTEKGRWRNIKTARIYIDDARAAAVLLHLPPGVNALLNASRGWAARYPDNGQ